MLIHIAVLAGKETIAKLLLDRGANIESRDSDGNRPLHFASRGDFPAIVKLLLEEKADIEAKDKNLNRPLHIAIVKQNASTVRLLLDKGASVEAENAEGDQPIHLAIRSGDGPITEMLLQKGASIKSRTRNGSDIPSLRNGSVSSDSMEGGDATPRSRVNSITVSAASRQLKGSYRRSVEPLPRDHAQSLRDLKAIALCPQGQRAGYLFADCIYVYPLNDFDSPPVFLKLSPDESLTHLQLAGSYLVAWGRSNPRSSRRTVSALTGKARIA
jgi:hypothetical protein